MGDYRTFTATANGNAAKTDIVSNALRNFQGGADPDGLINQYFISTATANNGEIRQCSQYAPDATGGAQALLQSAFTDTTNKGDTFEIHRIDPDLKHQAMDRAVLETFPILYKPIRDETIIVDSRLLNGDFEDFTSDSPDNWTSVNSPTLSAETTTVFHGTNSLKMVGPSDSVGQVRQDISLASITEVEGLSAKFKMRVWASAASSGRIIMDDGVTTTNSSYHSGDSQWELLDVSAAIGSGATRFRVTCEAAASATVYFDTGYAVINPLYRYTVPTSVIRGPMQILQQYDESRPDGPYYPLLENESPKEGRILRVTGMGTLSQPETESETTEIGEPNVRLVAAYAAMVLNQMLLERAASQQQARLEKAAERWARQVATLSNQPGIRMRRMPIDDFRFTWGIGEDSTSRYIDALASRSGLAFTTA